MRISDWSSACALPIFSRLASRAGGYAIAAGSGVADFVLVLVAAIFLASDPATYRRGLLLMLPGRAEATAALALDDAARGLKGWMVGQAVSSLVRSEEHTSELQSLMRISYAVFCLKKKKQLCI